MHGRVSSISWPESPDCVSRSVGTAGTGSPSRPLATASPCMDTDGRRDISQAPLTIDSWARRRRYDSRAPNWTVLEEMSAGRWPSAACQCPARQSSPGYRKGGGHERAAHITSSGERADGTGIPPGGVVQPSVRAAHRAATFRPEWWERQRGGMGEALDDSSPRGC